MEGFAIKAFSDKRYGFLRGEDGLEYFFHADEFSGFFDDLVTDLRERHEIAVTFEIAPSLKGPRAREVKRVDDGIGI